MIAEQTAKALEQITDEALFERLATAVLRVEDPKYRALQHTGVNAAGKTIKSPVDGIGFVPGADPLHLVLAHHTTVPSKRLAAKWLRDPTRGASARTRATAGREGDVVKAIRIVQELRRQAPELHATLALTTNGEPDEAVARRVALAGAAEGLEVEMWSRSRLAHVLDYHPSGQWIRATLLGIEQQLLSTELLLSLSRKSLASYYLHDDPSAWIARSLDAELSARRGLTLLVAESGMGKSVACYRQLADHIGRGLPGLVVSDEVLAEAATLDHAIFLALQRLHPALSPRGPTALSLASENSPLLLVVDDINRSGKAARLLEAAIGLTGNGTGHRALEDGIRAPVSSWRLICPVWPQVLPLLPPQVSKALEAATLVHRTFSAEEGRRAVLARARKRAAHWSALKAAEISSQLGHDPLLIALYDFDELPEASTILGHFIEGALLRASAPDCVLTALRQALRTLGAEMLQRRALDPRWSELRAWPALSGESARMIGHLAHDRQILHWRGPASDQHLGFRHDRVRDWIMADAAAALAQSGALPADVVADPYYSQILAEVAIASDEPLPAIDELARHNVLALCYALGRIRPTQRAARARLMSSIETWLNRPESQDAGHARLRFWCLVALQRADGADVALLVRRFPEATSSGLIARLRNGDIDAGVELCVGSHRTGFEAQIDDAIETAKLRYDRELSSALARMLESAQVVEEHRTGALRLAGHWADPALMPAIAVGWHLDAERIGRLEAYLWAACRCFEPSFTGLLDELFDAWGAMLSPDEIVAHLQAHMIASELKTSFEAKPPTSVVPYLLARAARPNVSEPIEFVLRAFDRPETICFLARSPSARAVADDWRWRGRHPAMSQASRSALMHLWQEPSEPETVRAQAFEIWAATAVAGELEFLRSVPLSGRLAELCLQTRVSLRDGQAVPALFDRLAHGPNPGDWWIDARHVWTSDFMPLLDRWIERQPVTEQWFFDEQWDWVTGVLIGSMPDCDVERLLARHWPRLGRSSAFVHAAFAVGTESLRALAERSVQACPSPQRLFLQVAAYLKGRWWRRPGASRESAVRAVAAHADRLSDEDFRELWELCCREGLQDVRQELLDAHPTARKLRLCWDPAMAKEKLDHMAAHRDHPLISRWIEQTLEAGTSWADVVALLAEWLQERRSIEALLIVAEAIRHRGSRNDLKALRVIDSHLDATGKKVVADAEFAVRHRILR